MTNDAASDERAVDPFLQEMTFTQRRKFLPSCDCDECGARKNDVVPAAIRQAVLEHKRSRKLKRTQLRELIHRGKDVVLWKWTMPCASEPLTEYGNSGVHRLIWVQRLSSNMVLKSIGSGVIGSADEEKDRVPMPWVQGDVIYLKSRAEKAVGWIADTINGADAKNLSPIVLCIAKVSIPSGFAQNDQDERLLRIRQLCISLSNKDGDIDDAHREGKQVSAAEAESFRKTVISFFDNSRDS